jgi:hypothetical protein
MRHNKQHGFVVSARLIIAPVCDKSKGRRTDEQGDQIGSTLAVSESDAT